MKFHLATVPHHFEYFELKNSRLSSDSDIDCSVFLRKPSACLWGAGGVGKAAEGAGAKHSATSGAGGVAGGDGRDDALTFPVMETYRGSGPMNNIYYLCMRIFVYLYVLECE